MPEALKLAEKVFKRFSNFGAGAVWTIGKDKWDALAFIPKKDVLIIGTMMPEYYKESKTRGFYINGRPKYECKE